MCGQGFDFLKSLKLAGLQTPRQGHRSALTAPARDLPSLYNALVPRHIWRMSETGESPAKAPGTGQPAPAAPAPKAKDEPREIGGPKGPEPTRYGDWERNGRCTDF